MLTSAHPYQAGTAKFIQQKLCRRLSMKFKFREIKALYRFLPRENFHLFYPGALWEKNFLANYFTQLNSVTLKFSDAQVFTHGCQAVLVVSHDHQSAVLPGIQNLFFLDLQPSLMSLLSYFHVAPWVRPILQDPYHQSYHLPPSQRPMLLWTVCSKQRWRKLRSKRSIMPRIVCTVCACKYGTSTFDIRARAWLVHLRAPPTTSWWATRAVGEIKFGEIFVPI